MKHRGRPVLLFLTGVALLFISQMKFSNQVRLPGILPSFHLSQPVKQHHWNRKCDPQLQVAFAKTHKTGSSTLQNIIFRWHRILFCVLKNKEKDHCCLIIYFFLFCPFLSTFYLVRHGDQHNLVFALPQESHVFSYREPFKASMLRYRFCTTEQDKTLKKIRLHYFVPPATCLRLCQTFLPPTGKYIHMHLCMYRCISIYNQQPKTFQCSIVYGTIGK